VLWYHVTKRPILNTLSIQFVQWRCKGKAVQDNNHNPTHAVAWVWSIYLYLNPNLETTIVIVCSMANVVQYWNCSNFPQNFSNCKPLLSLKMISNRIQIWSILVLSFFWKICKPSLHLYLYSWSLLLSVVWDNTHTLFISLLSLSLSHTHTHTHTHTHCFSFFISLPF